jgi:hypothetical protein
MVAAEEVAQPSHCAEEGCGRAQRNEKRRMIRRIRAIASGLPASTEVRQYCFEG